MLQAALVVGFGACGGGPGDGGDTPSGPADIRVIAKEYRFEPADLAVEAGRPVVVEVENIGSIPHDLTVRNGGFKLTVQLNRTGRKTLTVGKAGTNEKYCSLPGHKSAGMDGRLTVR